MRAGQGALSGPGLSTKPRTLGAPARCVTSVLNHRGVPVQSYPDKDVPPSAVDADAVIEDSIPARTVMAGGSIGLMGRRPPIVMATSEPEVVEPSDGSEGMTVTIKRGDGTIKQQGSDVRRQEPKRQETPQTPRQQPQQYQQRPQEQQQKQYQQPRQQQPQQQSSTYQQPRQQQQQQRPQQQQRGREVRRNERGEALNSQDYVKEVINLSVELDSQLDVGLSQMTGYSTGLEAEPAHHEEEDVEQVVRAPPPPPPEPPKPKKPAGPSEERIAVRKLMSSLNVQEHVGMRTNWMMIMAPEQPMAGEECVVLFNRLQSESLRVRPRIQMQYAFNSWQLKNEATDAPWTAELSPAPMPKEGCDFWWTRIKIPQQAYEINFVLSDGEFAYENNGGQDFMFPVVEGITLEEWREVAAEIARKKEEERLEAERKKAEEEARKLAKEMELKMMEEEERERRRMEDLMKQDEEKGRKRAEEVVRNWENQQSKGMVQLRRGNNQEDTNQPLIWFVEPDSPNAGESLTLYYNRKATNLANANIRDQDTINLRWGINGWKNPQVVQFRRCPQLPERVAVASAARRAEEERAAARAREERERREAELNKLTRLVDATSTRIQTRRKKTPSEIEKEMVSDVVKKATEGTGILDPAEVAAAAAAAAAKAGLSPEASAAAVAAAVQSAITLNAQLASKPNAQAQSQQQSGAKADDQDWWQVDLDIPKEAGVINFVTNFGNMWDNNGAKDYAIRVGLPAGLSKDAWFEELAAKYKQEEFETRVAAEEESKRREIRRLEKRRKAQEMVRAVERRKVRHVLFTEPEVVKAGQTVTMYYNPQDTPLNGRDKIFFMGGFNRWSHKTQIGPMEMTPPDIPAQYDAYGNEVVPGIVRSGSTAHWKCTFTVPHDAYKMDFVFSDVHSGPGTYDNRGGYDYHLPVVGSPAKEPSMYVVHIAVEMAPIAKVGGLGDVVTALGRAVQEQGHLVEVVVPRYEFFSYSPVLSNQIRYETEFDWGGTRIVVTTAIVENLRVWFIEPRNGFFNTQTVYGRYDDEVRFDFFCKAALEFLLKTGRQPDILHCHDWSTAHVAKAFWQDYQPYGLWKPKVVFTIHNLNYGQKKISEAAFFAQRFTTVSPTYAFETGGNAIIAPHVHKFCGIRNGIDQDLWDPENNMWLPMPITPENVVEAKAAAKAELRKRVNLSSWGDKILVAVVSRLTPQKGVNLIKHTVYRTLDRGGQFVLLGSAPDPKLQADFNELAGQVGGQNAAFQFKYDEPLSHLIYAAADIVVVPSMFEPCGLTQMIAMRYGAVPVVRHTGGLKDTVFDVDFDKARAAWELNGSSDWMRDNIDATNGFAFEGTDGGSLDYALNRAIDAWYNDRAWFHSLQRRVMEQDWSWNRPALDYIELYYGTVKEGSS